jgi:transposase
MYGKGLSTRDMQDIINDIYGVDLSPETIARIIDRIQPRIEEWQNRELKKLYTFVYVDALYVKVKVDGKACKKAVYAVVGIDAAGYKDVLGFWINETAVKELTATYGWRAYATNVPNEQLSLETAVLTYRDEWLIERGFHRLKGAPLSLDPMYVKRDDQATGLINLLSLAVRILTLIEFVVRRALKQQNTTLIGLHKENPKKENSNPTTERLLQVFSNIFLTTIYLSDRTIRHITPLSDLQTKILSLLDLSPDIYLSLANNSC